MDSHHSGAPAGGPYCAAAQAQPNIALVKYWGKRDAALNLPVVGSLSITLDTLWTRTRVRFDAALAQDQVRLNGRSDPAEARRVGAALDLLRQRAGTGLRAAVDSRNNFPTAAGLASSAEVDERYVQKQLGHASAEMTRKYQRRRDRFRINLTKASGL